MIHMDITYTDQFRKLHIWDPQSVKVYRKSGRVNYLQKNLGLISAILGTHRN